MQITGRTSVLTLIVTLAHITICSAYALPLEYQSTVIPPSDGAAGQACPAGYTWTTVSDSMQVQNTNLWTVEDGGAGLTWNAKGLTMAVTEAQHQATIQSTSKWMAPVSVSFRAKTQGFGGIVNSLTFRDGTSTTTSEIDLEIVADQLQVPIWTPDSPRAHRMDVGTEVSASLENGVRQVTNLIPTYGYTFPGFNPLKHTNYRLDWQPNSVSWTVGGLKRLTFTKMQDQFPEGPLPLRIGPWATSANNYWAGKIDWINHPVAQFRIKNLVIEGCRQTS